MNSKIKAQQEAISSKCVFEASGEAVGWAAGAAGKKDMQLLGVHAVCERQRPMRIEMSMDMVCVATRVRTSAALYCKK